MDVLYYLFAGAVGVAAALASIAIWAPRATPLRVAAVAITALFIPIAYAEMIEMLSKPKPVSLEWFERSADAATVLGVSLHEGKAIYLWLRVDDAIEPRFYVLPWRRPLAEKLEDAVDDAVRQNSTVVIKKPFARPGFDNLGEINVEIVPPPRMPMKPPPPPPRIFNPRDRKI